LVPLPLRPPSDPLLQSDPSVQDLHPKFRSDLSVPQDLSDPHLWVPFHPAHLSDLLRPLRRLDPSDLLHLFRLRSDQRLLSDPLRRLDLSVPLHPLDLYSFQQHPSDQGLLSDPSDPQARYLFPLHPPDPCHLSDLEDPLGLSQLPSALPDLSDPLQLPLAQSVQSQYPSVRSDPWVQ
jgi:hypothetical protein